MKFKNILEAPFIMQVDKIKLGRILALRDEDLSQAEIAAKVGVSQSTVARCLARNTQHGPVTHLGGNGRLLLFLALLKKLFLG